MRILLADMSPLLVAGIHVALQTVDDLRLLEEVCDCRCDSFNLIQQCRQLVPDVLLLQPNRSEIDFSMLVAQLHAACSTTKVLLFLEPEDKNLIRIEGFVQGGGGGAILSDEPVDMLINALRTVGHGGVWFSQALLPQMMQQRVPQLPPAEVLGLTAKESAIIYLLVEGKTDREIAQAQGIAERTVRYYLQKICDKLEVDTRVKVVVQALKRGIVDAEMAGELTAQ